MTGMLVAIRSAVFGCDRTGEEFAERFLYAAKDPFAAMCPDSHFRNASKDPFDAIIP